MHYSGTIYILTNHHHTFLYIGVISNLVARVGEHRDKTYLDSFTATFNCCKLVYYESFPRIEEAIEEEKRLKKCKRQWKENLVTKMNPQGKDLYNKL